MDFFEPTKKIIAWPICIIPRGRRDARQNLIRQTLTETAYASLFSDGSFFLHQKLFIAQLFSFHRLSQPSCSSPSPKPSLLLRPAKRQLHQLSITVSRRNDRFAPPRSIDVSQEDNPSPVPSTDQPAGGLLPEQETETPEETFDKRRVEEKFAVLNTGIYECRSCGYKYDEAVGDPSYPIPPGFPYEKLPDDWRCPTCGAAKSFFESKMVEIAGFAQNQQYGLGGNTLTSGQKTALIYGSLLLFFFLFLGGYFLQ